jgi:hypothetical protein
VNFIIHPANRMRNAVSWLAATFYCNQSMPVFYHIRVVIWQTKLTLEQRMVYEYQK